MKQIKGLKKTLGPGEKAAPPVDLEAARNAPINWNDPVQKEMLLKYSSQRPGGEDPWDVDPWESDPWETSEPEPERQLSGPEAARIIAERESTLGFRPFLAGVGGGAGAAIGKLASPYEKPIGERIGGAVDAFKEEFPVARKAAQEEEALVEKQYPFSSGAGRVAGLIGTAPLIGAKTLQGSMKLGGLMGLGQGLSSGENAEDVVESTALGMGTAGLIHKAAPPIIKGVKGVGKVIGRGASWTASQLTGMPRKAIETYYKNNPEVRAVLDQFGKDIPAAVDDARQKLQDALRLRQQRLSSQVGAALEAHPKDKVIDIKPVLDKLLAVRAKIDGDLNPEQIKEIDGIIHRVMTKADEGLNTSVQDMHKLKQYLMEAAKPTYMVNGQIMQRGRAAQRAAKQAGSAARELVNKYAPDVGELNNALHDLYLFDADIAGAGLKRLIKPGSSPASFLAAGSGTNQRARGLLERAERLTGRKVMPQAENISAASHFGDVGLLPTDSTGKAAARMMTGAMGAGALFGTSGAAALGAAMSSPLLLRSGIDLSRAPRWLVNQLMDKSLTPGGQAILIREATRRGLLGGSPQSK